MSESCLLAPHHDVAQQKADSTLRFSQAVPDPSTNRALSRLIRRSEEIRLGMAVSEYLHAIYIVLPCFCSSCWAHSPLLGQHVSSKEAGRTTLSGPHTKSASSVAATYKPPMLVPRVRLPAGAFHVCVCKRLSQWHASHACFCPMEYDLGRTRTCSPRRRGPMRYPLGHEAK